MTAPAIRKRSRARRKRALVRFKRPGTRVLQLNAAPTASAAPDSPWFMLRLFAILLLAVVVQTTLAPFLTVLGAKPDVAMVIVVCLAMMRGPVLGAVVGFSAGLLIDVALVQTLGISSFLFTLAGYFSGRHAEGVDLDSWFPPVITVFVSSMVVQLLNSVIMFLLGVQASAGFILLRVVFPSAFLNALLAAPVFIVCRWWLGGDRKDALFTK
ncbi:MAG: rod shape-determining protein MreD [Thermoleophilia bacterium]